MAELPGGTVTFVLTDVEGSTALWEEAPEAMRTALARHDALFEDAVARHRGVHIRPRGEGDSRFAVDGLPAPKNIVKLEIGATWYTRSYIWRFEYRYRNATGQTTHGGALHVSF